VAIRGRMSYNCVVAHRRTRGSREAIDMLDDRVATNEERIAAVVRSVLPFEDGTVAVSLDDDLHEFGMTSLNMVNLMLAIEGEFSIVIPQRDLHPDNFRSLRAINGLVSRLTHA
jgi:acyl carrier protein